MDFRFCHRKVQTPSSPISTCATSVVPGVRIQQMGLMHNYVIPCMRVRLGGIAKQVTPFFRECVFHFYILTTNIRL